MFSVLYDFDELDFALLPQCSNLTADLYLLRDLKNCPTGATYLKLSSFWEDYRSDPSPCGKSTRFRLFPLDDNHSLLDFDVLAATAWMLFRVEEYEAAINDDQWGRFSATQSVAHAHDALMLPMVQHWADLFLAALAEKGILANRRQPFRNLTTFDIDELWAYQHKSVVRQVGGLCRDFLGGHFTALRQKLFGAQDPYQTLDSIITLLKQHEAEAAFFFLGAGYGGVDQGWSFSYEPLKKMIAHVGKDMATYIHPSVTSVTDEQIFRKEYEQFMSIPHTTAARVRQHYLVTKLPDYYAKLMARNISVDYSMGFHDRVGFRAGTAVPYQWVNLQTDQVTDVTIVPFQYMDVTLKQYMSVSTDEARVIIQQLATTVQSYGGIFCAIWHNNSLAPMYGWEGWKLVFEESLGWSKTLK